MIFGYSKKQALNSSLTKLFKKQDLMKFLKQNKEVNNFPITGTNKSKKRLILDATLTHIHKEDNPKELIYLLIARDQMQRFQ